MTKAPAGTRKKATPRKPAPRTAKAKSPAKKGGAPAVKAISMDELQSMLLDPTVPDEKIRPYLTLDASDSAAFRPTVMVDPEKVIESATESALALASLNRVSRWRRQQAYRGRRPGWQGPVAVSEGDSWFQFPFLLEDVIDHLNSDYAIFSLGAAGDLLSEMVSQDELVGAVEAERPDVVFLSGGGNDLLGSGRLAQHIKPFRDGRAPEDYPKDTFAGLLDEALEQYAGICEAALSAGAGRIVCHTYDYAIPNNGRWLGRPFASLQITDRALQRDIVRVLIDRLHDGLDTLANRRDFRGRVIVADGRGSVPDAEWWDELHPTSKGFASAAEVIKNAAMDTAELPMMVPGMARSDAGTAALTLARHDEAILLAELGRRLQVMRVQPEVAGLSHVPVEVSEAEGLFDPLFLLGKRVLNRLHRELHGLICGSGADDSGDRARLVKALGVDEAAVTAAIASVLIGSLGVAPYVAPVVAAILFKRGIQPTVEEVCEMWTDAIED